MAINLGPSPQVQEQNVQEQNVQEQQRTWKDWQKNMVAYCHRAKANDQYAWSKEEEEDQGGPRCRFYENRQNSMDPNFQIYFRNLKEKGSIQSKINEVILKHRISEHGPSLYTCGDNCFSIYIHQRRKKANYVYKMYLIENITGYSIQRYADYKDEEVRMDEHAESVDFI